MPDDTLTIDFGEPIPLFPLPNCVLLPHATIPLHIFEQRYRAMTRDALTGSELIAMALFEGDDWRGEYQGNPPLRPIVCVGHVIRHQELPDGRFNILLYGVCRARIHEELASDPYRQALLRPLGAQQPMEIDLEPQRGKLEELLNDPLMKELASVSAVQNWLSREIPTHALIDLTIMTVCEDIEQRYRMLAEGEVESRATFLIHRLRDLRRTLKTAKRFEPPTFEGQVHVN